MAEHGRAPGLATVLVGDDPASAIYVANKRKASAEVGIADFHRQLPAGSSQSDVASICPGFTPTGPYPASCANFNQLGFRVPFVVVSPFAKPGYVSHTIGDHTSMLAFIEKRFTGSAFMTARDQNADTLEDMFDFSTSPSLTTTFPMAPAPSPTDPGCATTTTAPPTTTTTTTTTSSTTTTTFGCGPAPVGGCRC